MYTRKLIAFKALEKNRFVKIYEKQEHDKKTIEIVDDKSSTPIEMIITDSIPQEITIVPLQNDKIILLIGPKRESGNFGYTKLVLLDMNKARRLSELIIPNPSFFCVLPNNTLLLIDRFNNHTYIYSYENDKLKEEKNHHIPDMDCCIIFSNKILYCSNENLIVADQHFSKKVYKKISKHDDYYRDNSRYIKDLDFFSNGDLVCWTHHYVDSESYQLQFFNANLDHRTSVNLEYKFDRMAIINDEYVAMMAHTNNHLYLEVYNNKGKKVKELWISNLSKQLFDVTPEGKLVSCSKLGDITFHNLGLRSTSDEIFAAVKSSDSNISMDDPVGLVCEYLGCFFRKKIPHTQEIIYSENCKYVSPVMFK